MSTPKLSKFVTVAPAHHSLARCSFGHLRSVSSRTFFSLGPHGPRLRPSNKPDLTYYRYFGVLPTTRAVTVAWALAEDDNSEECAILCESGARPQAGVLWFAS